MSVGDVTHHLVEKVSLAVPGGVRWVAPDWTFRPAEQPYGLPGPLPQALPRPAPAAPPAAKVCDCGAKLAALLEVLSLPEGLRGLVLALAAAPGADVLDVMADLLEEAMDPRSGRFRDLAGRARKGAAR